MGRYETLRWGGGTWRGPRLVQREWLSARKDNVVLENLQLYVLDASRTRLVYPIDRVRSMPNMEVVTGHIRAPEEDRTGVNVSSRKLSSTILKIRRDFTF